MAEHSIARGLKVGNDRIVESNRPCLLVAGRLPQNVLGQLAHLSGGPCIAYLAIQRPQSRLVQAAREIGGGLAAPRWVAIALSVPPRT